MGNSNFSFFSYFQLKGPIFLPTFRLNIHSGGAHVLHVSTPRWHYYQSGDSGQIHNSIPEHPDKPAFDLLKDTHLFPPCKCRPHFSLLMTWLGSLLNCAHSPLLCWTPVFTIKVQTVFTRLKAKSYLMGTCLVKKSAESLALNSNEECEVPRTHLILTRRTMMARMTRMTTMVMSSVKSDQRRIPPLHFALQQEL